MNIARAGLGLLLGTVLAGGGPVAAKSPQAASVSVVAWNVRWGPDTGVSNGLGLPDHVGAEVTLLLDIGERQVMSIDAANADIHCTDDKGTDLLQRNPKSLGRPGLDVSGIAAEGHLAKLVLRTFVPPAEGATRLVLKGTVGVSYGVNLKRVQQENALLNVGSKFTIGAIEFEVQPSTGRASNGMSAVRLASHSELRAITSLRFLDAGGREIKCEPIGGGSRGENHTLTEYRDYGLANPPAAVTVEAEMYGDVQTLQVPVDLKLGVGVKVSGAAAAKDGGTGKE